MKKLFGFTIFIAVAMLLIPLWAISPSKEIVSAAAPTILTEDKTAEPVGAESFKVLIGDKVTEYSREDYIFGVVAAEMPALYHEEALKAQAVAAYTFACSKKAQNKELEYDITNDHTVDQSFITEEEAKAKWGDSADEYTQKIKKAVADTAGEMIYYEGIPILAVYHAISGGTTEDSKNVWGSERAYLKPVLSEGDKLAKNYITEVSFTADELKQKLEKEIELNGEAKDYLGNIARTDSGTVSSIKVCGKDVSGFTIGSLLSLRSANFEVKFADEKFTFTVYGAGHGVGMSQNGANYMAKQGSSYKEILTYYYSSCSVEKK